MDVCLVSTTTLATLTQEIRAMSQWPKYRPPLDKASDKSLFGGSCFFWCYKMNNKRTSIYIDGFNLYYGCLKKSPYKWLDLKKLFESLLDSSHQINKIKYYTAHISSRNDNEASRTRQRYYLNALDWTLAIFPK